MYVVAEKEDHRKVQLADLTAGHTALQKVHRLQYCGGQSVVAGKRVHVEAARHHPCASFQVLKEEAEKAKLQPLFLSGVAKATP